MFRYAGEQFQYYDVGIHQIVRAQRVRCGAGDLVFVIMNVHTRLCQRRIIGRYECAETFGTYFSCTVSSQQMVAEKDTHFRDQRFAVGIFGGSYFDGGNQVFFAVGSQHADGKLRAGENNRFVQIFEHETEGRCRVCHRVGSVQDDKPIE